MAGSAIRAAVRSGFLLRLQHLPALVHPGLQIEMMRAAQFAGVLVFNISRLLERICRAAHATPRGRSFSSGNGHNGSSRGIADASPEMRDALGKRAAMRIKAGLIEDGWR